MTLTAIVTTYNNTDPVNVSKDFSAAKTSYVINMNGSGNDTVTGSGVDEILSAGKDFLKGSAGNDILNGDDGNDVLNGV